MNSENTKKLAERFPTFFEGLHKTPQESCLAFGFECGDGWMDLIWNLCLDIEKAMTDEEKKSFKVSQVKEKFAGMRFYTYGATEKVNELVQKACKKSYETCELCGAPSKVIDDSGWYYNMCEKCWDKFNNEN